MLHQGLALLHIVFACVGALALLILAWHDLRRRRLPNQLVALVAASYLLFSLATPSNLLPHLATALLALLAGFALTALRVIGGGDAKLFAALAFWAGPMQWWIPLVIASQVGLLLVLLGLIARWALRRAPPHGFRPVLRCLTISRGVPYGIALAVGGWVAIICQL